MASCFKRLDLCSHNVTVFSSHFAYIFFHTQMFGGVLFMTTTFVDDVIQQDIIDQFWLGSLLFTFYWLYFPLSCGAQVVYEKFTAPYLGPTLKPLQQQMSSSIIYLQQALSNVTHLYLVWIVFMFLPAGVKRVIAIAIGTVYPHNMLYNCCFN